MTGWRPPGDPNEFPGRGGRDGVSGGGPPDGWVAPSEADGPSITAMLREGWTIARSRFGPLARIAALPTALIVLLSVPAWLWLGSILDAIAHALATIDWVRYRTDPQGLQSELQAAMRPGGALMLAMVVSSSLVVLCAVIGLAAITDGTLLAAEGTAPSTAGTYRRALGRRAVVLPALVLAVGYGLVLTPIVIAQPGFVSGGTPGARASIAGLLSGLTLLLEVLAFYLAVRWMFYFQVAMSQPVGVIDALRRAAVLSEGIRVRMALLLLVLSVAVGVGLGVLAAIAAGVTGLLGGSLTAAFTAGAVAYGLGAILAFPLLVAVVTAAYRRQLRAAGG